MKRWMALFGMFVTAAGGAAGMLGLNVIAVGLLFSAFLLLMVVKAL